jgi:hypothetical protein
MQLYIFQPIPVHIMRRSNHDYRNRV